MKYFDILSSGVEDAFIKRGVFVNQLLYCVKADMDGEGCYIDQYITFTKDTLHMLSGYETYDRVKNKKKLERSSKFEAKEYDSIPIQEIESMYVDRLQNTARLMVKKVDESEVSIARFSLGFAEKFEQFSERVNLTKKGEPIDDTYWNIKKHIVQSVESAFLIRIVQSVLTA